MWRELTLRMEYLIKLYPDFVSKDLRAAGENLYLLKKQNPPDVESSILDDPQFLAKFKKEQEKLLDFILEDLGLGAPTLAVASAGIYYSGGDLKNFILPLSQEPASDWMVLFRLRNLFALPSSAGLEFAQDDMNALIYAILCLRAELNPIE